LPNINDLLEAAAFYRDVLAVIFIAMTIPPKWFYYIISSTPGSLWEECS